MGTAWRRTGQRAAARASVPHTCRGGLLAVAICWAGAAGGSRADADVYVTGGLSGGPRSLHGFTAMLWTPLGELGQPGPVIRGSSLASLFSYRTDLPGDPDRRIDVAGAGLGLEAGWQWHVLDSRLALLAGVGWRDHRLTPPDPGSSLEGSSIGWSLAFDADLPVWERLGVMANGHHVFGPDQYWVEARPYWQWEGGLRTGATVAAAGGEDYLKVRAGLFATGYEFRFGEERRLFIGGEAGAELDLREGGVAPFAGLHVGFFY